MQKLTGVTRSAHVLSLASVWVIGYHFWHLAG